jgi:hypoxanthine-guanine phosphoribosyltransferase
MLDKKIEKKSYVKIDWKGFDIEDTWVYGYGMDDVNGTYRQVPFISDE